MPFQDDTAESEWDATEWGDAADITDDDETPAECLLCPSCNQRVHEDTQQCPHCGDWIIPVYPKRRLKRIIWVVAAMLILVSFALAMMR